MRQNEIQNGTSLYFPHVCERKVKHYIVENHRASKDDANVFVLDLRSETGELFHAEQWDNSPESNKSSDRVDLLVSPYSEFGYGGKLQFFYSESGALKDMRI